MKIKRVLIRVYVPSHQLTSVVSLTMSTTLTQQRARPGVKSWYRIRPSCAIMWQHEKHRAWCVAYAQPSPDRRRKNSQQWLGSCWSLSTLDVSLSVIIFHGCHVDQIYTHSRSIYQASSCGTRKRTCIWKCALTCTGCDTIPWFDVDGRRKKIIDHKICWDINFSPDLMWIWKQLALINCNFKRRECLL